MDRLLIGPYAYTVRLEEHLAPQRLREAFFHEVLHGISQTYCIGLTEDQIAVLSPCLLETFDRNEGLAETLQIGVLARMRSRSEVAP